MKAAPYPLIYRLFHSFQIVVHSFNLYAGSPSEPFLLVVHAKKSVISNLCSSCTKVGIGAPRDSQQNRGFDLYRLIVGAECYGVSMRCVRHPGYRVSADASDKPNQPRVLTSVAHNVAGIKQVYKQVKTSIEELKNVIDLDVRGSRENQRYACGWWFTVVCTVGARRESR